MMMSNGFFNTTLETNKQQTQQQPPPPPPPPAPPQNGQSSSATSSSSGNQNSNNTNNSGPSLNQALLQSQLNNYAVLTAAAAGLNSNLNSNNANSNTNLSNRGNITPPNSTNNSSTSLNANTNSLNIPPNLLSQLNAANSNFNNPAPSPSSRQNQPNPILFRNNSNTASAQQQQLTNLLQQQQQQQQKKLAGLAGSTNLLNFSNTSNTSLNTNLINSTISRPPQQLQQSTSQSLTDPTFSTLDPSDFPVLHRTTHSPFQQQQQQFQQLQQQLRANSFNQNAPQSAPILNSTTQSLIMQLASVSASSNNLNSLNLANGSMMMLNGNGGSNTNLSQFNSNNMLHQSSSLNMSQSVSNKMWSNFGSTKDRIGLKTQQSNIDNPHQEFVIQQEDFPALPRPQSVHNKNASLDGIANGSTGSSSDLKQNSSENLNSNPSNLASSNANSKSSNLLANQNSGASMKKGIVISPDGRIKNVPSNMLLDQFGMVGLLAYLRAADKEKDFFVLALGTDLTALGLNLNSNDNLYHSFLSPFSDISCRLQDLDFAVPTEYIINSQIKEKLAPIDLTRYHEDTLFYLFYMSCGDLMQLQAAAILYDKDWRYHVEKKFWLTKANGVEPQQKTTTFEKGYYIVFDVMQWRRVQTELTIEYCKLAEKPQLPTQFLLQQQQQQLANNNNITSQSGLFQQQLQQQQQAFTAALNSGAVTPAALASITANPASAQTF